jgi:DNA-binding response OmpR family regulator
MPKILVVEDELPLLETIGYNLEQEGYQVVQATDGLRGFEAAKEEQPDLILLDIMLPEMDGMEVCRRLRTANNPVPIIMVTARDEDVDKILGLELGADDYLAKPFNPRELVARVKAILRRVATSAHNTNGECIRVGDLTMDLARREARVAERLLDLRTQEFEVLLSFAQNPGIVLTREKLLNLAWGYGFFGQTRTVDVHVAQLRRKIGEAQVRIETVTGIGYKLVV